MPVSLATVEPDTLLMTKVSIILVGCGAVSRLFYVPALRHLAERGELEVFAAVDRSREAADAVLKAFPAATFATTIAELPKTPGLALAIIASPPGAHREHTLAAASRGWHVLCEKPMAASSAECPAMIEACRAAGVSLSVGHYKRYFPASLQLRELCAGASPLGKIRSYEIQEGGPFNWPAASPSFFQKAATPGGVLLDIGIHVFDLLLWWMGEPLELHHADDAMGGLEINTCTRLRHAEASGVIRLSRDWHTAQRYRFDFEHGSAEWTVNDANGLTLRLDGLSHAMQSRLLSGAVSAPTNPQSFILQLAATLEVARGRKEPLVDGHQAMAALNLVERCYAAKTLIAQPWLTATEAARAATLAKHT